MENKKQTNDVWAEFIMCEIVIHFWLEIVSIFGGDMHVHYTLLIGIVQMCTWLCEFILNSVQKNSSNAYHCPKVQYAIQWLFRFFSVTLFVPKMIFTRVRNLYIFFSIFSCWFLCQTLWNRTKVFDMFVWECTSYGSTWILLCIYFLNK